ncbi:serine/threonine-protein kinase [Nocardia sp. NBC_00403]|uniref:serine/threonine-protein kinase n=1 Tax=Nocardia sp. NBC_00403 TaxID=2975990 RepID=UPI002E1A2A30
MQRAGLVAGELFAGYRIERVLGRGGMGTVYLAAHPRLPRQIALKLLSRELYADEEVRARFEREADVAARLDHPNVVSVFDRGAEDHQLWISMQYVDGSDAAAFRGASLDPRRALHILGQTADALDHAHESGVLHRDVKPANILLTAARTGGDRVLLTDFGIARLRDDAHQLTRTGEFLATLAYAAPEQLSGQPVDHRADQYALGCTLFALLTGEAPFAATNPGAVVAAHLTSPVPQASRVAAHLPSAIDAVIARAMAKDPRDRFGDCTEFAEAAYAAVTGVRPSNGPRSVEVMSSARAVASVVTPTYATPQTPDISPAAPQSPQALPQPPHTMPQTPRAATQTTHALAHTPPPAPQTAPTLRAYTPPHPDVPQGHLAPQSLAADPPSSGGQHERDRQRRTVSSRWRALAVALLVLAVVAIVGVAGAAAVYWKYVRPHRLPAPPVWGAEQSIVQAFPQLIPPNPNGTAWRGARCSAVAVPTAEPGDPVPLRQITCTHQDGLIVWFSEYASGDAVGAYLAAKTTQVGARPIEDHASVLVFRPLDAAAPFTLAARARGTKFPDTVSVEVSWPNHTFEQASEQWWERAPF